MSRRDVGDRAPSPNWHNLSPEDPHRLPHGAGFRRLLALGRNRYVTFDEQLDDIGDEIALGGRARGFLRAGGVFAPPNSRKGLQRFRAGVRKAQSWVRAKRKLTWPASEPVAHGPRFRGARRRLHDQEKPADAAVGDFAPGRAWAGIFHGEIGEVIGHGGNGSG